MYDFEKMWAIYNEYKEVAEQHDFMRIMMMDAQVYPYYRNLCDNYSEKNETIFCDIMRNKVFPIFGIKEE